MKNLRLFLFVFGVLGLLFLSSCQVQPEVDEPFYLKYHMSGGFVGYNRTMEFFENGDFIFRDEQYSYTTTVDEQTLLDLHQAIIDNNFLGLNESYDFNLCMDDFIYSITYVSATDSHTVTTNSATLSTAIGNWKNRFRNVLDAMYDYKSMLDMDVDSGFVKVSREYPIVTWPYSAEFKLSTHRYTSSAVSNEIYNFVDNYENASDTYYFLESDTLYRIYTSTDNTIQIYYPYLAIRWDFEPALGNIPDNGMGIYGNEYLWLADTLNSGLPGLFYDTLSGEDVHVYSLWLRQGNLFEKGLK